jgi:hypothetical protein
MLSQYCSIGTHNEFVIKDAVFKRYYVQHVNVSDYL